jgi:glycosyltransferase involved in cell wall biosynthesis
MRIGVVPVLRPFAGGEYQHTLNFLQALAAIAEASDADDYVLFLDSVYEGSLPGLTEARWTQASLRPPSSLPQRAFDVAKGAGARLLRSSIGEERAERIAAKLGRGPHMRDPGRIQRRPDLERWFRSHGVSWVLYPNPNRLSFEAGLPYVMLLPDIGHRRHPELADFAKGVWEHREYVMRNGARHATLIIADSEIGKADILEFYGPEGVTEDRVKVLPNIPAVYLSGETLDAERGRVRKTYGLPEKYMFYPAQFWPHKNHVGIVRAIGLLRARSEVRVHVVFSGAYDADPYQVETFAEVTALARELGVTEQIHCLGYVPDQDMSGLYTGAVGLVIPLFLATANMPILEAWAFGCPVLASDIRGVREQISDAGLLVDPASVEKLAEGLARLWTDETFRSDLAERGRRRLAAYSSFEDFRDGLATIIREASERVAEEGDRPPTRASVAGRHD